MLGYPVSPVELKKILWGERVWASWSASWASLLGLAVGELEDFPATFYGLNLWRIDVRKRQKSRAVEMAKLQCREKRCRWSSLNTRRNSFLSEPFSKSSALHSQNCDESFLVWQIRCVHDVFVLLCDCHKTHQRCEQVSPDILQKSLIAFVPKPTPKKGHSWHAGTNLVVGALSLAKSNSSFWMFLACRSWAWTKRINPGSVGALTIQHDVPVESLELTGDELPRGHRP